MKNKRRVIGVTKTTKSTGSFRVAGAFEVFDSSMVCYCSWDRAMSVSSMVLSLVVAMSIDVACILGREYCMNRSAMTSRSLGSSAAKSEAMRSELI